MNLLRGSSRNTPITRVDIFQSTHAPFVGPIFRVNKFACVQFVQLLRNSTLLNEYLNHKCSESQEKSLRLPKLSGIRIRSFSCAGPRQHSEIQKTQKQWSAWSWHPDPGWKFTWMCEPGTHTSLWFWVCEPEWRHEYTHPLLTGEWNGSSWELLVSQTLCKTPF